MGDRKRETILQNQTKNQQTTQKQIRKNRKEKKKITIRRSRVGVRWEPR